MSFFYFFSGSASSGSSGPPDSLEFDGSSDYLSMSNANWGAYDRSKFALAGAFYLTNTTSTHTIYARYSNASAAQREFIFQVSGTKLLVQRNISTFPQVIMSTGSGIFTSGQWYSYLYYYDSANPVLADTQRLWINGSEITAFDTKVTSLSALNTGDNLTTIGYETLFGGYLNGLLYQPTFFSGSLPASADVFNGTSGKLKDLSGLTGVHSLLDASTATNDVILATDWTNNGTVTTSATIP